MSDSRAIQYFGELRVKRLVMLALLLFVSPLLKAGPVFGVLEEEYVEGPIISAIKIKSALIWDSHGKPHLNLQPQTDAEHAKFISILSPGIPFGYPNVQDNIAADLSAMPEPCLGRSSENGFGISLLVAPIDRIDQFVPGVSDKRRVRNIYIGNCISVDLEECEYDTSSTGAVDFTLGTLLGVIERCSAATHRAVKQGERYADWVYAANPRLRRPALAAPSKSKDKAP